ncbi:MAG: hypothetical protein ACRCTZ_15000 [Sarcina sp.]
MIKPIRCKKKVTPIGANAHMGVDNIITLYRSSNDIFNGVLDYIFFKVLNLEPVEYFNVKEFEFEPEEKEIEEIQSDYLNYELKYKKEISKSLEKDIEEVVLYIRKKALEDKKIYKFTNDKYLEDEISYSFEYVIKKIMDYYKER